jgi:hypothetical protein
MAIRFSADLDSKNFETKLRIFSSGLGGIFKELMKSVGEEIVADTRARTSFHSRTGRLFNAINFIPTDSGGVLTTRKTLSKPNVYYARLVEKGAYIKARKGKYLAFKIDGEWKRVPSVRVSPRPFMTPVFNEYFESDNGKGYRALQDALKKKMAEYLGE